MQVKTGTGQLVVTLGVLSTISYSGGKNKSKLQLMPKSKKVNRTQPEACLKVLIKCLKERRVSSIGITTNDMHLKVLEIIQKLPTMADNFMTNVR